MIGVLFLPVGFITFGTHPSPTRAQPAGPSPSGATESNPELQKILFQAQVQEIAAQRRAATDVKQIERINSPGILTRGRGHGAAVSQGAGSWPLWESLGNLLQRILSDRG
jgi:hypothetical protein